MTDQPAKRDLSIYSDEEQAHAIQTLLETDGGKGLPFITREAIRRAAGLRRERTDFSDEALSHAYQTFLETGDRRFVDQIEAQKKRIDEQGTQR